MTKLPNIPYLVMPRRLYVLGEHISFDYLGNTLCIAWKPKGLSSVAKNGHVDIWLRKGEEQINIGQKLETREAYKECLENLQETLKSIS